MSADTSESKMEIRKFLPFKMETLTPEIIRKAEEELNETLENKREALKEMRRLINAERDFRPIMEEKFLLRFLRSRKFDPEVAIKTLKNYYTYKVRYSGEFTDILPSELEHVINMNIATVLSHRDQEGSIIGIGKLGAIDLNKVSMNELLAIMFVGSEVLLQSEVTQICGVVMIGDCKGLSLRLVRHFASPGVIYRFVRAIQDCIPSRIKAVHLVNEPFYFSLIYNILRKFLSEKIRNRFHFHGGNLQNLHKQVPPEILPREYGGQQDPMDSKLFAKEVLGTDNYFAKMAKYGFQENRAQLIKRKSSMAIGLFQ